MKTKETRRVIRRLTLAVVVLAVAGAAWSAARGATDVRNGADAKSNLPSTRKRPRATVGTIVRFNSSKTSVDVTIDRDNPAVRDFLSMLPLTLSIKELSGREKISYLPRKLKLRGSPGSDPKNGDLIYFVPWGNLGFYYNAAGIGYSDATIHMGTYRASPRQLSRLQGRVTVKIARGARP